MKTVSGRVNLGDGQAAAAEMPIIKLAKIEISYIFFKLSSLFKSHNYTILVSLAPIKFSANRDSKIISSAEL